MKLLAIAFTLTLASCSYKRNADGSKEVIVDGPSVVDIIKAK